MSAPLPYYRRAPLRFRCTGCGACCTGGVNHEVALTSREAERIRKTLDVTPAWFRKRYLTRDDPDQPGIRLGRDGRCPFLGRNGRCRIYAVRPRQCRTYPWWPELISSRAAWLDEARRCEGMNQGEVVPLERIMRTLASDRRK